MEEKDVTFNFYISEPDDNGNQDINITSDIDDCTDYLSVQEKMCLMLEIITQCGKQIISEDLDNDIEDIEDFDANNPEHEAVIDNLHTYIEEIIYLIINAIHNLSRAKFGKTPETLEYSLITYKTIFNDASNTKHIHRPEDTFHSRDVDVIDPMQASFDLYLDTIMCFLNNNSSKSEIKKLISGSLDAMKDDFMRIIDEYNN